MTVPEGADVVHRPLTEAFAVLVRSLGGTFEDLGTHAFARCTALPIPGANGILDHGRDQDPVVDAIGPMLQAIAADRTHPWVVTFEGRDAVIAEAARAGLHDDGSNAGMVLERAAFRPVTPTPGVRVSLATEAEPLRSAGRVFAEAFGLPEALFARLYEPTYVAGVDGSVILVLDDDEPVSTAIAWPVGDDVGIFSVATPERFRGRGFGAVATSAAIGVGFDAGASRAFLQSSAMGEGVYRRLGFREVCRYLFLGPSEDADVPPDPASGGPAAD